MNKPIKIVEQQPQDPVSKLKALLQQSQIEFDDPRLQDYISSLQAMGIAKNLNANQMYHFLKYCYRLNLDPFLKQVHCVPFRDDIVPITSYYEYIKRASKHPNYQLPELEWVTTDHEGKELPVKDHKLIASIQRKGDTSTLRKVFYMHEWNLGHGEWAKKPHHMLEVRAIKNLLAVAYPDEVAALETPLEAYEAEIKTETNTKTKTKIEKLMGDVDGK